MVKGILAVSAALAGVLATGGAQAYTVSFGQSRNANAEFPITAFTAASAARTRFFGSDGILGAQNFESLAAGVPGPLSLSFGSGDSSVTATLSGVAGKVVEVAAGTTEQGRFSVEPPTTPPSSMGTKFWETTATNAGATFELWFDNPVVKFGFFGVDIGDFDGLLELEILSGTSASNSVIATVKPGDDIFSAGPIVGAGANGSVLYFGVGAVSEAEWFRGVRFRSFAASGRSTIVNDVFAFDSFTVVAAPRGTGGGTVPVPGTLALLGVALVGLSLARRR